MYFTKKIFCITTLVLSAPFTTAGASTEKEVPSTAICPADSSEFKKPTPLQDWEINTVKNEHNNGMAVIDILQTRLGAVPDSDPEKGKTINALRDHQYVLLRGKQSTWWKLWNYSRWRDTRRFVRDHRSKMKDTIRNAEARHTNDSAYYDISDIKDYLGINLNRQQLSGAIDVITNNLSRVTNKNVGYFDTTLEEIATKLHAIDYMIQRIRDRSYCCIPCPFPSWSEHKKLRESVCFMRINMIPLLYATQQRLCLQNKKSKEEDHPPLYTSDTENDTSKPAQHLTGAPLTTITISTQGQTTQVEAGVGTGADPFTEAKK